MAVDSVKVDIREREAELIRVALEMYIASVRRKINNPSEASDVRALWTKLVMEIVDLSRKFGGV